MKKILYHGSSNMIEKPLYGFGKINNDYGQGFYCTEHMDFAKEWACNENLDGYVNQYEIELEGLLVLDLSDENYNILNWLAIIMENRIVNLSNPIQRRGKDYLIKNFLPDYKNADIIIGYHADDAYFLFARAFVSNQISLKQLNYAMKLGKLGEQYCIKTKLAFSKLVYKGCEIAKNEIYYEKRKNRDDNARNDFYKELEHDDIDGIYMRDIIKEGYINGDKRLPF